MNEVLKSRYIGSVKLKNSLVMAPCCMYSANDDAKLQHFHFAHYEARAIGGVGLIIVEATAIEPRGRISNNDLGLYNKEQMSLHKKLVQNIQGYGSKMAIQIAHAGRKSRCVDSTPVAPSSLLFDDEYKVPGALSLDEIEEIKKVFINSAVLAKEAGYDMIELHAAHGYLLNEFLSPLTNQRTDKYGGTLENRCSLIVQIAKEIKEQTKLPLIVRVSASEWMHEGYDVEDIIFLCEALEKVGVDAIHVSAGGNHAKPDLMPTIEPLYQVEYAKKIKESVTIPIIAVGLINTYEECQMVYKQNAADFIAMGRGLLRNPNIINEFYAKEGNKALIQQQYQRAY